jgi:hypothetical protein
MCCFFLSHSFAFSSCFLFRIFLLFCFAFSSCSVSHFPLYFCFAFSSCFVFLPNARQPQMTRRDLPLADALQTTTKMMRAMRQRQPSRPELNPTQTRRLPRALQLLRVLRVMERVLRMIQMLERWTPSDAGTTCRLVSFACEQQRARESAARVRVCARACRA